MLVESLWLGYARCPDVVHGGDVPFCIALFFLHVMGAGGFIICAFLCTAFFSTPPLVMRALQGPEFGGEDFVQERIVRTPDRGVSHSMILNYAGDFC